MEPIKLKSLGNCRTAWTELRSY